jgi:hypothetical protein
MPFAIYVQAAQVTRHVRRARERAVFHMHPAPRCQLFLGRRKRLRRFRGHPNNPELSSHTQSGGFRASVRNPTCYLHSSFLTISDKP